MNRLIEHIITVKLAFVLGLDVCRAGCTPYDPLIHLPGQLWTSTQISLYLVITQNITKESSKISKS